MTAQQPKRIHRQPPPAENPEPPIPYVLPQNTRGQQPERLSAEREQEIRERLTLGSAAAHWLSPVSGDDAKVLLDELDARTAEREEMEGDYNEQVVLREADVAALRADLAIANERVRALETALRLVSSHWVETLIRGWEEPLSADGRETVWDAIDPTLKDRLRKVLLAQGNAREAVNDG